MISSRQCGTWISVWATRSANLPISATSNRSRLESYTAFLDARFLFGEAAVADSFTSELLSGLLRRSQRRFLRALVDMKDVRHERYGGTVFQLEPDLKDAPGGLRDYHWTHWVTRVLALGDDDSSVEAVGFLHRLRNYLHFMSGRDQNELSYEYQERIAAELGYTDSDRGEAAEHLMHDYFLKAEEIARSVSKWEGEIVGGPNALSVGEQPRDQRRDHGGVPRGSPSKDVDRRNHTRPRARGSCRFHGG